MDMVAKGLGIVDVLIEKWSRLPGYVRLYLAGLAIGGFSIALMYFHVPKEIVSAVLYGAISLLCIGFIIEAYGWLKQVLDSPLFKLVSAVSTVLAASLATASSSMLLGNVTQQDPAYFKFSIAILAPFAFLPLLALVITVTAIFSLPLVILLGMSKKFLVEAGVIPAWVWLARILGVFSILAFASLFQEPTSQYNRLLKKAAGYSAFLADLHDDDACSETRFDRVVRINDEIVILGRIADDGVYFVRRVCPLTAQSVLLPPPKK